MLVKELDWVTEQDARVQPVAAQIIGQREVLFPANTGGSGRVNDFDPLSAVLIGAHQFNFSGPLIHQHRHTARLG